MFTKRIVEEEIQMKLHYKGKYNLDSESLPHGEHQPGAVQFKEANDSKQMSIIMNVIAFIIIIPLFVIGSELMSKGRFIFMSLLPNLVFGFIPFVVALCVPSLALLGVLGAINIVSGSGDYYNVFNALTQMPKGARTYLYQFHSYWYMPEERDE